MKPPLGCPVCVVIAAKNRVRKAPRSAAFFAVSIVNIAQKRYSNREISCGREYLGINQRTDKLAAHRAA